MDPVPIPHDSDMELSLHVLYECKKVHGDGFLCPSYTSVSICGTQQTLTFKYPSSSIIAITLPLPLDWVEQIYQWFCDGCCTSVYQPVYGVRHNCNARFTTTAAATATTTTTTITTTTTTTTTTTILLTS